MAVIIFIIATLAAIGFAILYVAAIVALVMFAAAYAVSFATLYFMLGEANVGWAILLALPLSMAVIVAINKVLDK